MELSLKGLNILIIGGDRRELELYFCLKEMGARVLLYGFDRKAPFSIQDIIWDLSLEISRTHVIITPLNGIEEDGLIYTPLFKEKVCVYDTVFREGVKAGTLFIAGYVNPVIKKTFEQKGIIVCETREMDEISILNAIPTAEGAIQFAMQNTEFTINNSNCLVLGYGRCGRVLAEALKGLGANVTVSVRKSSVLAWVIASRMNPLPLGELVPWVHKYHIIFNTIPAVIISEEVLSNVQKEALIIDLASYPGGVNHAAAERLSIKAVNLPGLPGKVAPKTAGQILCQVYPRLIINALKGGKSGGATTG